MLIEQAGAAEMLSRFFMQKFLPAIAFCKYLYWISGPNYQRSCQLTCGQDICKCGRVFYGCGRSISTCGDPPSDCGRIFSAAESQTAAADLVFGAANKEPV